GRCSPGARASAARTTSSSCVRPKNPAIRATVPARLAFGWIRGRSLMICASSVLIVLLTNAVLAMGRVGGRETHMHAQVVTFGLNGITDEQFREACEADAPTFATLPGLLAKLWLRDPETNTYGGLYLWADQEAYERYIKGEVFNAIKA